jgi:ketosteroid isomerase-like protein
MVSHKHVSLPFIATLGIFSSVLWADSDEDVKAIHDTYIAWVASTNSKDINLWATFVAPGAIFLPPDTAPLESIKSIVAFYTELFGDPNFSLDCAQLHVEIADSGDMAWSRGTCEATFSLPDGTTGHGSSKWAKVWVLSEDGRWKCRLNTWNGVQPPASET